MAAAQGAHGHGLSVAPAAGGDAPDCEVKRVLALADDYAFKVVQHYSTYGELSSAGEACFQALADTVGRIPPALAGECVRVHLAGFTSQVIDRLRAEPCRPLIGAALEWASGVQRQARGAGLHRDALGSGGWLARLRQVRDTARPPDEPALAGHESVHAIDRVVEVAKQVSMQLPNILEPFKPPEPAAVEAVDVLDGDSPQDNGSVSQPSQAVLAPPMLSPAPSAPGAPAATPQAAADAFLAAAAAGQRAGAQRWPGRPARASVEGLGGAATAEAAAVASAASAGAAAASVADASGSQQETKRRRRGLLDRAEQGLLAPGPAGGASSSSSGLPPPQVEVLASGVMTQTLSRPDLFDAPTLEEQLEVQRREQARSAAAAPPQPPLVAAAASLTSRVRSPAGVDAGDSDIFRDDIPAARVHDRMAWTPEEEQRLVEGQRRFGNRWETVRTTCNLRHRTGSQLREKFRNLQRAGVV